MFRTVALFPLLALAASSAVAGASAEHYRRSMNRGLDVYELGSSVAGFRLICDGEGGYPGQKVGGLFAFLPKDRAPTRIVFVGADGSEASLPVDARTGEVLEGDVAAGQWAKLTAILRRGGSFALVSKQDSVTFSAEPLADLSCP